MTTIELKSLKLDLLEELMAIDNQETLNKIKSYVKKLKRKETVILNNETLQAIEDVKSGKVTHCVSFDDYLNAVK